ncbi:hypothetical protein ACV229_35780 [Burkholderia sp. MR1-5-21]
MADLFGVAGGEQWREYTGGAIPRELRPQILFLRAARLALFDGDSSACPQRCARSARRLTFTPTPT